MEMELEENSNEYDVEQDSQFAIAPEIYIFTDKDIPGFKFIDQSPAGVVAKFAGSNPGGVFTTVRSSLRKVSWDDEVNIPNKAMKVRYRDGSQTIYTLMVSLETFKAILENVNKQINEGNTEITINTNLKTNTNVIDRDNNELDNTTNKRKFINQYQEVKNQLKDLKDIEVNNQRGRKDFKLPNSDNSNIEDINNINDASDFGESSFKL